MTEDDLIDLLKKYNKNKNKSLFIFDSFWDLYEEAQRLDEEAMLPIGENQSMYGVDSGKQDCYHVWIRTNGFRHDYWLCEKCGKTKPLREEDK